MVPKPLIHLDQRDPCYVNTGRHFNRLLARHGSPIIVLDLVKKEEKRRHESMLSEEYTVALNYLNQFLPYHHRIQYIPYDMATINKSSGKSSNVLHKLEEMADYCVSQTSIFTNKPPLPSFKTFPITNEKRNKSLLQLTKHAHKYTADIKRKLSNDSTHEEKGASKESWIPDQASHHEMIQDQELQGHSAGLSEERGRVFDSGSCSEAPEDRLQTGVVRSNCIDCLDRTNTAQFVIAMKALVRQLHCLGVLHDYNLHHDSDCIKMMEELFEDQGDTLALQYGGSQLVHRIKGYRKLSPWTTSSRDMMQSLSRYYSNTFSDSEKQNSINLFHGIYRPSIHHNFTIPPSIHPHPIPSSNPPAPSCLHPHSTTPLWTLKSDFHLHNQADLCVKAIQERRRSYTKWWQKSVLDALPHAHNDQIKWCEVKVVSLDRHDRRQMDLAGHLYKHHSLTLFQDLFLYNMISSIKDFMPKNSIDRSPFCPRIRKQSKRSSSQENIKSSSANPSSSIHAYSGSSESIGCGEGVDDQPRVRWKGDSSDSLLFAEVNEEVHCGDITSCSEHNNKHTSLVEAFKKHYGVAINPPDQSQLSIYQSYINFEIRESPKVEVVDNSNDNTSATTTVSVPSLLTTTSATTATGTTIATAATKATTTTATTQGSSHRNDFDSSFIMNLMKQQHSSTPTTSNTTTATSNSTTSNTTTTTTSSKTSDIIMSTNNIEKSKTTPTTSLTDNNSKTTTSTTASLTTNTTQQQLNNNQHINHLSNTSMKVYQDYVHKSIFGAENPSSVSLKMYKRYVNQSQKGIHLTTPTFKIIDPILV